MLRNLVIVDVDLHHHESIGKIDFMFCESLASSLSELGNLQCGIALKYYQSFQRLYAADKSASPICAQIIVSRANFAVLYQRLSIH
jgi:hypothetical protein